MSTATMTRPASKPKVKPPASVSEQQHLDAAVSLQNNCMKVSFVVTGLPRSRKLDEAFVQQLAALADGEREGFSAGKRLFDSDDDSIKRLNAVIREIDAWRDLYTTAYAGYDDGDKTHKAKGVRIIRIADIAEFEQGLEQLAQSLADAVAGVADNYDAIMNRDKARLGNKFSINDYPAKESLADMIRIGSRDYSECAVSMKLPPLVRQRMEAELLAKASATIEVAVEEIKETFKRTFSTLANQLVRRVRIMPVKGHRLFNRTGAEIIEIRTPKEEPDLTENQLKIKLKWKDTTGSKPVDMSTYEIIEKEELKNGLRASTTDETKRLSKSTIENALKLLDSFPKVKEKLGPYGTNIDDALDSLRDLLSRRSNNDALANLIGETRKTDDIHAEIKNSETFKTNLKDTLDAVMGVVEAQTEEVREVRRRLSKNVLKKTDQSDA